MMVVGGFLLVLVLVMREVALSGLLSGLSNLQPTIPDCNLLLLLGLIMANLILPFILSL
jgi:hypothetical protein